MKNRLTTPHHTEREAGEADRVRRHTSSEVLKKIDADIERRVAFYSAQPDSIIAERIEQLKREWSIERYLQVNVASVGLATGLLALFGRRAWAALTCGALGFFLYHALEGYDPPLPLLRRMGVRTRKEIDRELYALKAMRGDFSRVQVDPVEEVNYSAKPVLDAVNA